MQQLALAFAPSAWGDCDCSQCDAARGLDWSPPAEDKQRLERLLDRVRALMRDGAWRTLGEIVAEVGGSEAGVSARLRDLRKRPICATVERRRRGDPRAGLWEYRVEENSL